MKNVISILDFGSGKITCFVGTPTTDGFIIKAAGQSLYGGYNDGEWLEPEKLKDAVDFAIKQAETGAKLKIKSVYVGVPGEFTSVVTGEGSQTFHSKRKINKDDTLQIMQLANVYGDVNGYTTISRSSIYFELDDGERTIDPCGRVCTRLSGLVSFVFASSSFVSVVGQALSSLNLTVDEYVSGCLAEALFLISPTQRDNFAILLDVGYISSSVMLVGGDGLLFLKSFSLGSGHIIGDISQVTNVAYPVAEQLYNAINLNLDFEPKDVYVVKGDVKVEAQQTNEVARARIEEIAHYIMQCFELCPFEIPHNTPMFITGGGLCYTKGAIECLSRALNKNIKVLQSSNPLTNKHGYASAYGLLDIACKQKPLKKRGLLSWLIKK